MLLQIFDTKRYAEISYIDLVNFGPAQSYRHYHSSDYQIRRPRHKYLSMKLSLPNSFKAVWLSTFLTVFIIDIEYGIAVGAMVTVAALLYRNSR